MIRKLIFYICLALILYVGVMFVADIFVTGVRIMFFGMKLMFVPIVIAALCYVFWHIRKK